MSAKGEKNGFVGWNCLNPFSSHLNNTRNKEGRTRGYISVCGSSRTGDISQLNIKGQLEKNKASQYLPIRLKAFQ